MNRLSCQLLLIIVTLAASLARAKEDAITPEELALVKLAETARVRTIAKVQGSVVAVYGNDRRGGGAGVLFDPGGFALTNHHVVAAAGTEGWGGLADGKLYRWRLIGTDPGGDLAVIQLTGRDAFPTAELGISDSLRVGDWAMAMGNPFVLAKDHKPTVTLGIVSGVQRYQPGSGAMNQLIYGNCIQVDCAINPGNSGGPLFNARGQVVGINGRGSFKERGRVNVGLGYAISMKQIRNFIPDLLAAKVVPHGALDAVFATVDGKVVCQATGNDSVARKAGIEPGDRLLSLEGRPLRDANEFMNLITTFPAGWPIRLTCDRKGRRRETVLRLGALPYAPQGAPSIPNPGRPGWSLADAGKIRDQGVNQANCARLIRKCRSFVGVLDALDEGFQAVRLKDRLTRGEKRVGEQTLLIGADGRFRVEYAVDNVQRSFGFDGARFWNREKEAATEFVSASALVANPHFAQAVALAGLFHLESYHLLGKQFLDGGDMAAGRRAYRVKVECKDEKSLCVWANLFDDRGQLKTYPLKAGQLDGKAITFAEWKKIGRLQLPMRRDVVEGIAEKIVLRMQTEHHELLDQIPDDAFKRPENADRP
ncbi:MAG: trypsin-like peptidase domain-containing protein [Planctomycetales bacterium]